MRQIIKSIALLLAAMGIVILFCLLNQTTNKDESQEIDALPDDKIGKQQEEAILLCKSRGHEMSELERRKRPGGRPDAYHAQCRKCGRWVYVDSDHITGKVFDDSCEALRMKPMNS